MKRDSVTFGNIDEEGQFSIIFDQKGFDPLAQRSTLGFKWSERDETNNLILRGFWFETQDLTGEEILLSLNYHITEFLGDEEKYGLYDGMTPVSSDTIRVEEEEVVRTEEIPEKEEKAVFAETEYE